MKGSDYGLLALFGLGLAGYAVGKYQSMTVVQKTQLAIKVVSFIAPLFRVAPSLILAVIGKESKFNPSKPNLTGGDLARGGAWGFMQVTLATAKNLQQPLAKSLPNSPLKTAVINWKGDGESLSDPSLNIAMGTFYLSRLLKRYNNDADLALAAYNGGEGSVDRALAKGENPRERQYVQDVKSWIEKVKEWL